MSLVGFSTRSYRTGSRRPRFGGGARRTTVTRTAASSSLPQWAVEQHQELLVARDKEAWAKLAAGATEEFIAYAKERIAATTDPATQAAWNGFLITAQKNVTDRAEKEFTNKYLSHLQDMEYGVQAGEQSVKDFIGYLIGERGKYAVGDAKHTALTKALMDAKDWADAMLRAQDKQHDQEMAAMLSNNEITLEDALKYLTGRRDGLKPGDEAYANLTTQIANVKTGIAARDFNAEMHTASAALVDAGSTAEAKQTYLGKLIELTTRAKSPEAQKALGEQITKVREAIVKDKTLEESRLLNKQMVDYYAGKQTASETLEFLTSKAAMATDPTEANRYTTMAAAVVAREHQLAKDVASGSGGGSGGKAGTAAWTDNQLARFKSDFDKALDAVNDAAKNGETLSKDDPRWQNLQRATGNYGLAMNQLSSSGLLSVDGQQAIDGRVLTVGDAVQSQVDLLGSNAIAEMNDLKGMLGTSMKNLAQRAADSPDTPMTSSVVSLLAKLDALAQNSFIVDRNQKRDALTARQSAQALVSDAYAKAGEFAVPTNSATGGYMRGETTAPMKTIEEKFKEFQDKWAVAHKGKTGAVMPTLGQFMDDKHGVLAPVADPKVLSKQWGVPLTASEVEAFRKLDRQDEEIYVNSAKTARSVFASMYAEVQAHPELQKTMRTFLETHGLMSLPGATAIYADLTGNYGPGGALDESTRAAAMQEQRARATGGGARAFGKPQPDLIDLYGGVDNMYGPAGGGNALDAGVNQPTAQPDVVQFPTTGAPGQNVLDAGVTDQQPPDSSYAQSPDAQDRNNVPTEAPTDPFAAGWAFLTASVDLHMPTFELPPLPTEADFTSAFLDPGISDWQMPDMSSFFPTDGGYNVSGPSFDPGFTFNIPAFDQVGGSGSTPGEAAGGPELTQ